MDIKAVLFDADGVLQRPSPRRRLRWEQMLDSSKGVDAFLVDVFAAEEPALTGRATFVDALTTVLSGWRCSGTIEDALDAWTMIDVDPDVATTIGLLRRVVITGTRTISRDGKVMTITNKGTNAKGQTVNDVLVFEKR